MTKTQVRRLGLTQDRAHSLADYVRRFVRPTYPANDVAADLLLQTVEDAERIANTMQLEASGWIDPRTGKQMEPKP